MRAATCFSEVSNDSDEDMHRCLHSAGWQAVRRPGHREARPLGGPAAGRPISHLAYCTHCGWVSDLKNSLCKNSASGCPCSILIVLVGGGGGFPSCAHIFSRLTRTTSFSIVTHRKRSLLGQLASELTSGHQVGTMLFAYIY